MKSLFNFSKKSLSNNLNNLYDLVVIGGGPGGYVAAIKAAQLGMNVACVEMRGSLGGTCLNEGCIPSKALLHASEVYMELDHMKDWGIQAVTGVPVDGKKLQKEKSKVVNGLTKGIEQLFKANGVTYIKGKGKIMNKEKEVKCELLNGGEEIIQGKNVIIATGSEVTPKDFLPIDEKIVLSSTGGLDIETPPEKLAVMGVGAIALELGSVWSRFGSDVTVFYYKEEIAKYLDKDLRKPYRTALQKQGINFKLNTNVIDADIKGDSIILKYEDVVTKEVGEEEFDKLLLSVGRRPFFEGVGIEELGIELTKGGQIKVNEVFQTNVDGIYAIGDCIPGPMLAHKAEEDGIMCVEYINDGTKYHIDYNLVPGIVYTKPEASQIGLREEDLEEGTYITGSFPFAANGRAKAMHENEGLVKIIADAETYEILGMHMLGPCVSEMIMEGSICMHNGITVKDLALTCHPHPTLSEAIKEAAMDCYDRAIHKV